MRGQDRYGCSNHVMNGSCANGHGIRRTVLEERVLAGLKEKLMAPEAAAEAMRAWAEETNRLNRERHASGEADRQELAAVKKKMAATMDVIEDDGYVRGMVDRLRELKARQDELEARLAAAPVAVPDIHPNVADILPPEGGASGGGAEQPRRARRGRGCDPGADRTDRAHARHRMGEDRREAGRRPRHHPRMDGRQGQAAPSGRSRAAVVGLGGCEGRI